jgi:hypothetical protein
VRGVRDKWRRRRCRATSRVGPDLHPVKTNRYCHNSTTTHLLDYRCTVGFPLGLLPIYSRLSNHSWSIGLSDACTEDADLLERSPKNTLSANIGVQFGHHQKTGSIKYFSGFERFGVLYLLVGVPTEALFTNQLCKPTCPRRRVLGSSSTPLSCFVLTTGLGD